MKNIRKYLEDKRFIQWVFSTSHELDEWWKTFEDNNPEEKQNLQLAKRILQKLRTSDKALSEDEKILLFTQILTRIEKKQHGSKSRKIITGFMKYAAVALIFFSIGALFFYQKNNFNPAFYPQGFSELNYPDQAILKRPGGEDILLDEKNSRIEHRQDGQLVINNHILEAVSAKDKGVPEINQLMIPYGKTSEVILPDGTKVWLNAGSRLIYPDGFRDKVREVFLVGEAYFEVTPQDNQPFIVQTTDIRIRVLGTSFNISAYASDHVIETVLTEGKVRIEQNNSGFFTETTEIKPGNLAAFNKTDRTTRIKEVDVQNYTLWKDGLLKFESTDLSRIVKRLERYYNIRFNYDNPFLGGIKISGKLELTESRESILDNIATVASVKITGIDEGYYKISR